MARKSKKKTVHWSKQPRAKLIGMVKKLELANAKLKTQIAEARETRLSNETRKLTPEAVKNVLPLNPSQFPWEQT